MKKIENMMIQSLNFGTSKCLDNTEIICSTYNTQNNVINKKIVKLHENIIAIFEESQLGFNLKITDAGWKTKTTKSRLNAILEFYYKYQKRNQPLLTEINYSVYQHNYEWYISALGEDFHFDSLKDENGFINVNYYEIKELQQCKMY